MTVDVLDFDCSGVTISVDPALQSGPWPVTYAMGVDTTKFADLTTLLDNSATDSVLPACNELQFEYFW